MYLATTPSRIDATPLIPGSWSRFVGRGSSGPYRGQFALAAEGERRVVKAARANSTVCIVSLWTVEARAPQGSDTRKGNLVENGRFWLRSNA
jgi:hypothetical protein